MGEVFLTVKVHVTGLCGLCGAPIKRNGLSMVSHLRAHVRKGELIERPHSYPSEFKRPDTGDEYGPAGAYF